MGTGMTPGMFRNRNQNQKIQGESLGGQHTTFWFSKNFVKLKI